MSLTESSQPSSKPPLCPACGGQIEWSAARQTRVCAHCGTAYADEAASVSLSSSAHQGFPASLPPGFGQSPLGKLVDRFSKQQPEPGSFVRGLNDLSADARKAGVFSTLGSIAKAVWWLLLLGFAGLAVLCVVGVFKGRDAGILWIPAGIFALIAWLMLSASAKK